MECESDIEDPESVTFYHENSAINFNIIHKKLNVSLAWDVYFEFKTGARNSSGTLFHAFSPFDELIISISNDFEIDVQLNSQHYLSFQSLTQLNDNQWHSVLVEYNIKEITLYVDKMNCTQKSETFFYFFINIFCQKFTK